MGFLSGILRKLGSLHCWKFGAKLNFNSFGTVAGKLIIYMEDVKSLSGTVEKKKKLVWNISCKELFGGWPRALKVDARTQKDFGHPPPHLVAGGRIYSGQTCKLFRVTERPGNPYMCMKMIRWACESDSNMRISKFIWAD